jgi:cbb3-type cytochrome oxidase subunit 3
MRNRLILFASIVIACSAILLLAGGLSRLTLQPGKELPNDMSFPESNPSINFGAFGESVFNIFRFLYLVAWILFPVALIYLLLTKEGRKRLLKELLRVIPFVILFLLAAQYLRSMIGGLALGNEAGRNPGEMPQGLYPGPQETFIPSTPPWSIWIASFALAVLIVAIIGLVAWLFWRRRKKRVPLSRIAEEAQTALDAIESGGDLRNIVIRCYYDMVQVLNEFRGIRRGADMTPHEFQQRLEEKGFPREPVRALTALFEEVRYGQVTPGKLDEQRAISSLTSIVNYVKG